MTALFGNFRDLKIAWELDNHDLLYFDPQVLERYKQDPKYKYSDTFLSCNEPNEIFDITRIFTGKNSKGEKRIAVWLVYLLELPESHQTYWISYLKKDSFKIDRGSYEEGIEGKFTRHIDPITAIYWELEEINNITKTNPFLKQTRNDQLQIYAINSREKFINYCLELNKLLIDNIRKETFKSFFSPVELHQISKKKNNKTIRKLQKLGEKFHCDTTIQSFVEISQKIKNFRKEKAHDITQDKNDDNYIEKQKEITTEVYNRIKELRKCLLKVFNPKNYKPHIYVDEVVIE